jgi:aspartate aminotransferase
VPEPYYASISTFCRTLGIEIQPITTYAETAFCLPPREELESLLTERTRAILLSNPGNPTGTVYSEEEIRAVATIARQHDLFVIADEVYREFIFDDLETPSFGSIESIADRVILIDSISKRFSACGARIGSIASKNEELNEALLYLARARLSVPTLEQVGAAALYRMDPAYFDALRRRFSGRRDLVFRKLNEISGVLCKKSRGALYTIAKLPVTDATDFARWLLTDFESGGETLHLAPAEPFYATEGLGRSEVRIAHVLEEEDLERAMDLLKEALEIYPGD